MTILLIMLALFKRSIIKNLRNMVNLNELKSQGWLTCRQIIGKFAEHNPSLMKKLIKEKGEECPKERKEIIKRKDGENEYLYSPDFVKKVSACFFMANYQEAENLKENLSEINCYTSKELAFKFRTTQPCLLSYIKKEGLDKTGLVKETEEGHLIEKSLFHKLESHFLSNRRYG